MEKSIHCLLKEAINNLKILGLEEQEAENEARIILGYVLKKRPLDIYLVNKDLTSKEKELFFKLLKKRLQGEPLAYVLKEIYFYGRKFFITQGALIPRPETELLVQTVLETLPQDSLTLCELGIGSGVVGISLALERPSWKIIGVEKSASALAIALKNRKIWKVEDSFLLVRGDWLTPLKSQTFKALVTNPPYIAKKEWKDLPLSVKDYEPKEALEAGIKGMDFIKKTLKQAPYYLEKKGFLFMEIGYNQASEVKNLALALGYKFSFRKDLLGYERVFVGQI